jgi:hypothetical protein
MTSREKFLERISAGNREVKLAEVDAFMVKEGFKVRRTTHSYLYRKEGHRLTLNAHRKILHPQAVKELRTLLSKIGLIS